MVYRGRVRCIPLTQEVSIRGRAKMGLRSTHDAESARIGELFNPVEHVELEQIVSRYGVGVDCHSRFYEVCALAKVGPCISYHFHFTALPKARKHSRPFAKPFGAICAADGPDHCITDVRITSKIEALRIQIFASRAAHHLIDEVCLPWPPLTMYERVAGEADR